MAGMWQPITTHGALDGVETTYRADPLAELLEHVDAGRPPPLAWVLAYAPDGVDIQRAWEAAYSVPQMIRLVRLGAIRGRPTGVAAWEYEAWAAETTLLYADGMAVSTGHVYGNGAGVIRRFCPAAPVTLTELLP